MELRRQHHNCSCLDVKLALFDERKFIIEIELEMKKEEAKNPVENSCMVVAWNKKNDIIDSLVIAASRSPEGAVHSSQLVTDTLEKPSCGAEKPEQVEYH
ncbi:unnamed protein product [Pleuronectes platessa]|uniref:Uncharacterized protein n=1 Tax=Pleuronectes platessa TaxID=8262 RepID=A0A9N7VAC8_PLEPL|nr:unnamed protein product [Pleuronectes platessa]